MGKGSKKLYWAGAGTAFLLVLLIGVAFVLPRVIDSAWLKGIIQSGFAEQVDGDLDFQKVELTILPTPSISLKQIVLTIPETVKANLEVLRVYPKVLPLFSGSVELNRVVIDTPDLSLSLPQRQEEKTAPKKAFSLKASLENGFAKLTPVLAAIPGLEVDVRNGTLRLHSGEKEIFLYEDINGDLANSSKSLTVSLSSNANIWESMELEAKFTPESQEAKGEVLLKNTNNKLVADYILPGESPLEAGTFTTLKVNFSVSPETGLTASVKSSGSSFTALHEDKKITAEVGNIKASMQHTDELSILTVEDLTLSYPQVQLSGSFTFDRTIPHAVLDIKTQNSDIKSVYEVLPVFLNAIYGDMPVVEEIFNITKGGIITSSSLHIEGKSLADLAVFEAMLIQGHIENADVTLSDLGLNLQGVTGDVNIVNGIFEGKNVQAQLGKTTGSNGSLKLGLIKKEITPFHLDLALKVDIADAFPTVKQMLPDENIQRYFALIETYEGEAQGRLTLGESLESLNIRVEVEKINARAKLKPVPYLITVDGGSILYDGQHSESHNLRGKIGKSSFSNYTSRINLEGEPTITVDSGTFHIVLDEIYPWLSTYRKLEEELKNIKDLTGIADITVNSIKGHLFKPAELQYDVEGSSKNIVLNATILPGPLNIKSGRVHIIPDKVTFENFKAGLLDSSIAYSGVLQNFISGTTNAEIIVTNAEIGEDLNTWFVEEISAPKEYQFRTPLLISRAYAKWTREELIYLQGDFSIKNGPIFSIDVMLNPDELLLKNLLIKNDADRAIIGLDLKKRKIGARFQGRLSKKTIDQILPYRDVDHNAWIQGDFRFHIDKDASADATASGKLEGGDFILPLLPDNPLVLENFSLSASDKTITLYSAEAEFENFSFSMNGTASLSGEQISVDLDVKTDTIELDKILETFQEEEKEKGEESSEEENIVEEAFDFSLVADINIKAGSLMFNGYTWDPFESKIIVSEDYLGLEVLEARLCNISTPGKISLHEGKIYLDVSMKASDQEFSDVLICLEGGEKQMSGTLNLNAGITGYGTEETLINSLQGNLHFSAEEGRIYHDAELAKLLNFLNFTNLFEGKIPDLKTAGFYYDSLIVKGAMENGVLLITPAKLDAPIMEIAAHGTVDLPKERVNLQVLVAPIKVFNRIQRYLPIIRRIIPSNLIAIPVEVGGDFSDIQVRAMSMSAIGTRTLGVMFDAFSTPVRVLEGESSEVK